MREKFEFGRTSRRTGLRTELRSKRASVVDSFLKIIQQLGRQDHATSRDQHRVASPSRSTSPAPSGRSPEVASDTVQCLSDKVVQPRGQGRRRCRRRGLGPGTQKGGRRSEHRAWLLPHVHDTGHAHLHPTSVAARCSTERLRFFKHAHGPKKKKT